MPNYKIGYIATQSFIILDLDTLTFVEVFESDTGRNMYYKAFSLSPGGNLFLAMNSSSNDYLIIIKFDTKTEIWSGRLKNYFSSVTAAIQIQDNIFLYADSKCGLWIIDVINNLHLLFIDLRQYEQEEFNHYPVNGPLIKTLSVIQRDKSANYTMNQI